MRITAVFLSLFSGMLCGIIDALDISLRSLEQSLYLLQNVLTAPANPAEDLHKKEVEYAKRLEASRTFFSPFEHVMGCTQQELLDILHSHPHDWPKAPYKIKKTDPYRGSIVLTNLKTDHDFLAGTFKLADIKSLRAQFNTSHLKKAQGRCRFSVVEGNHQYVPKGEIPWFRPFIDVPALQADKANKDAVFQVASNFNGLEAGGKLGFNAYMSPGMYVQGEAAALSAMPGAIVRMYLAIKDDADYLHEQVDGDPKKVINFLDAIPEISVHNGYPEAIKKEAFKNLTPEQSDAYVQKVKIGFHENTEVTSGLGPLKTGTDLPGNGTMKAVVLPLESDYAKKQVIHQVFTAAFNMATVSASPEMEQVARIILRAAYEGTLLQASVAGKKKLFLTLIGGGVFKNNMSWIIGAIEDVFNLYLNSCSLEDIILIVYDASHLPADQRSRLSTYVQKTGGNYTIYG